VGKGTPRKREGCRRSRPCSTSIARRSVEDGGMNRPTLGDPVQRKGLAARVAERRQKLPPCTPVEVWFKDEMLVEKKTDSPIVGPGRFTIRAIYDRLDHGPRLECSSWKK
jgi:hypothetical protein